MNILSRWRERRHQKKKLRELTTISSCFHSLDQLANKGLLSWDGKTRRLLIEQSLAYIMMRNADAWTHFINNVYLWQYSRLCDQYWADYFQKEELKAVREASKKYASLTRADINRIREARRAEIQQSELDAPKIEAFEFFIIAPPDLSEPSGNKPAGSPVGQLIAVGHYNPETEQMETALWRDLQSYIMKGEIASQ